MRVKIILLLFCILLCSYAFAVNLTATADSYICSYSTEVNTNFGTENLFVKYAAPALSESFTRKVYIKFSLSSLNLVSITQASLNLTLLSGGGTAVTGTQIFRVYALNDLATGETWGESTITWSNAPGNNTTSGYLMNSQTTLLGTFTINGVGTLGSTIQFSNTNLVNFLNNDRNDLVTLMITRETYDPNYSGHIHAFASREAGATGPILQLETVPIPEVNSIVYLVFAFIFVIIKKL